MNNPTTTCPWQTAYLSAVLETDSAAMPTRIYQALAAIKRRLLSAIEISDLECREIARAQSWLLMLKAEGTPHVSKTNSDSVERDSLGAFLGRLPLPSSWKSRRYARDSSCL
jgi:hypothetical protein